jgi:type I restriction enzyme R subunit
MLRARGWTVRPWTPDLDLAGLSACALEEYPTTDGPADYALVDGGRVIGVVEAKRVGSGPAGVLTQAERYGRHVAESAVAYDAFRVPFLYSTNGVQIFFEDVRAPNYRSRELAGFHTPTALREALERRLEPVAAWLAGHPNEHPHLRPYQIEANNAVEAAILRGERRMLVAMATGTGKTYTTVPSSTESRPRSGGCWGWRMRSRREWCGRRRSCGSCGGRCWKAFRELMRAK